MDNNVYNKWILYRCQLFARKYGLDGTDLTYFCIFSAHFLLQELPG
jgi:hypothetical protein